MNAIPSGDSHENGGTHIVVEENGEEPNLGSSNNGNDAGRTPEARLPCPWIRFSQFCLNHHHVSILGFPVCCPNCIKGVLDKKYIPACAAIALLCSILAILLQGIFWAMIIFLVLGVVTVYFSSGSSSDSFDRIEDRFDHVDQQLRHIDQQHGQLLLRIDQQLNSLLQQLSGSAPSPYLYACSEGNDSPNV